MQNQKFTSKSNILAPTNEQLERLSTTQEQRRNFLPNTGDGMPSKQVNTIMDVTSTVAQDQANQISNYETTHNILPMGTMSTVEQYSPANNNMYAPPINCSTPQPSPLAMQEQNNQMPTLQYASHYQPINQSHYMQDPLHSINRANSAYKIFKEHVKIHDEQQLMEKIGETIDRLSWSTPKRFQCAPVHYSPQLNLYPPKLMELSASIASQHHDDLGILILCLGVVGAATWGRVDVEVEDDWIEKTPSMQLHACAPGTMKSSAVNELRKPVDDFQVILENLMPDDDTCKADEAVKAVTSKDNKEQLRLLMKGKELTPELLDELRKTAKTYVINTRALTAALEKNPPMLLVDKTTPSGFVKILHAQGEACACISAEGDFVDSMLLKNNSEPSLINKLFDQEPFAGTINRKNIQLKHPAFSMLSFVQHDVLSKFYSNERLQNLGTAARVLPYLHSGKKFFHQNYVPHANAYNWYYQKIIDMLKLYYTQEPNAKRYTVQLKPEAIDIVRSYKQELANTLFIHEKEVPARSKLCGQAVSFAWDIHACNYAIPHDHPITAHEVTLAIELCRMLQYHIAYVYDPSGLQAYKNAKRIIENLQNINMTHGNDELSQGYINSRTLQQRTHIKAKDILHALKLLQLHGWITMIDNGKRSYIVILNPRIMQY